MAVRVLVFGAAGNGKSTLINACLGKKILPIRTVSCTAIVSELKYSEKKKAILHFYNRHFKTLPENLPKAAVEHIKKFSGEDIPPMEIPIKMLKDYLVFSDKGNYAGTGIFKKIELFYPHLLLKDMEFIDTPSVEKLDALTEYKADIFFCVLNAERFGASEEMSFVIEQLWGRRKDIFFIINKYDHIRSESRERAQKYVKMKLKVYGSSHICFVSAKDALNGKIADDLEKYKTSGVEELQNEISEYMEKKRQHVNTENKSFGGDFFSWENFSEITDFEHHLAFVEMMIHKYKWEEEVRKNLILQLKRIKKKQQDKKLNLSVVGDFSTGKSTFINALLREELLTSSSMQGTTVVSTIMEYSKDYIMKLRYNDKSEECFQFDDNMQGLKEKLAAIEPEIAKKLYHVEVSLPSEALARDIRIIDTPGTNAVELWHEEATIRAINETSDISIILVNATKVLPETFCTFIENNLSSVLGQCVFVVTKYDLLQKKERDRVIAYIRQKLEKQFGLKNPLVLPYAAPDVIDDFTENTSFDSVPELLKISYENETVIFKHMEKQRIIVQAKKLIKLTEEVYGLLSEEMKEISASCQNYLKMLQETQQTDLDAFVAEQKQKRNNSYDRAVKEKRAEAVNYFNECSENAQKQIYIKMGQGETYTEIKNYIRDQLEKDCIAEVKNMLELSEGKIGCVIDCFREEMRIFQEEFKRLYKNLDILETDFSEKKYDLPTVEKPELTALNSMVNQTVQKFVEKNPLKLGGAAAGAAAGTIFAPGIGTVVGGIVGLFAGNTSYPSVEEGKKIGKESLELPLRRYFDEVAYHLTESFDKYRIKVKDCIFTEIDRYLIDYKDIVAKRIADKEKRKKVMESRLQAVKKDMDSVERRKFRMDSVKGQLEIMSESEK